MAMVRARNGVCVSRVSRKSKLVYELTGVYQSALVLLCVFGPLNFAESENAEKVGSRHAREGVTSFEFLGQIMLIHPRTQPLPTKADKGPSPILGSRTLAGVAQSKRLTRLSNLSTL